jgi:hypothetical protein
MLRTETERFMKEMHDTQQAVVKLMASLQPKEQALKKKQLLDALKVKRQDWQEKLNLVPASSQTKFLLSRLSRC